MATRIGDYSYEVRTDPITVLMWDGFQDSSTDAPRLRQECQPDGKSTPWKNTKQAREWIIQLIENRIKQDEINLLAEEDQEEEEV